MVGNEQVCLATVLEYEGGFADNPADPGGATMKGVTQRAYDAYRAAAGQPQASVRKIADAELRSIYRNGYWAPIGGDNLPAGVDLATFDAAVNSGPAQARRWLSAASPSSPEDTISKICAARLSFMHAIRQGALWKIFGRGWAARVADVEAKSIHMATADTYLRPEIIEGVAKKAAEKEAKLQRASVAPTAAGGGAVVAAHSGFPPWIVVVIVVAAAVAVAVLFLKSRQQTQRVAALSKVL